MNRSISKIGQPTLYVLCRQNLTIDFGLFNAPYVNTKVSYDSPPDYGPWMLKQPLNL